MVATGAGHLVTLRVGDNPRPTGGRVAAVLDPPAGGVAKAALDSLSEGIPAGDFSDGGEEGEHQAALPSHSTVTAQDFVHHTCQICPPRS